MSVGIAVIGCGYWGRHLVRCFRELHALSAVCDTEERGRRLARELAPGARVHESLERALAEEKLDGAVIASPAEAHHAQALRALEAGLDVLVEKPLALSAARGRELVELARARDRILMVGHLLEYHPGVVRMIEMVRAGDIGELRYVYSHRLNLGKVRREENILWSFAPHDIAVLLRLIGEMPESVTAGGGTWLQAGIADVTVTQLSWKNGLRAHVFVSWLHPWKEQRFTVVGSKKMLSFDDVKKELWLYDQRVDVREGEPVPFRGEGQRIPYSDEEPLQIECRAFLDAVRTRKPPLTDGESGVRVLEVLEMAQASLSMWEKS